MRDRASALPPEAWREVTWRQGTQGPQRSRFAACRVQPAHGHVRDRPELEPVLLLIEWPTEAEAPTKYWFSNLPEEIPLRRLVQLAKLRWWSRIINRSKKNWGWIITKGGACKAGITTSLWFAWPCLPAAGAATP